MVSKELLQKLREIIKEDFDEELDDQRLHLIARGMVGYFDLQAKLFHRILKDTNPKNESPPNKN